MKLVKVTTNQHLVNFQHNISKIPGAKNRLFLSIVVLPTFLAIIYFSFIASDIYVSESRFIVRSPSKDSMASFGSGLGGMIGKIGLNNSENDSFTAENYIQSRAALDEVNTKLDILKAYSSSNIDRFHRYGGLRFWDKSMESFYEYYVKDIVSLSHDPDSGITALSVRAFSPTLAHQVNQQLNDQSEALINRLNLRARQDMLEFAQKEVELANTKVEDVNQKIFQFRTQRQGGTPDQQVALFQKLNSQKDFAERNMTAALASLEQARIEAVKKQLYLERVSQPNKPDMALEPKRIRGIATTLVLTLVLWGIASMILAGIREHSHHG